MSGWAPYEGASRCSAGPMPGGKALMAWALEEFGDEGIFSLGIFNCRPVRGGTTTSLHGEGRADDLGVRNHQNRSQPVGEEVLRRLAAVGRDLGVQCVIYARRIYSQQSPNGRPYKGVAPHWDHLHVELTKHAGATLTLARCRELLGTGAPTAGTPGRAPVSAAGLAVDGKPGPATWRAVQQSLNTTGANPRLKADGDPGPATIRALQMRTHHLVGQPKRADGKPGPLTWKALQAVVGVRQDGDPGVETWKAVQRRLNAGEL